MALKKILNDVAEAGVRGGNEIVSYVRSGKAEDDLRRLSGRAIDAAKDAKKAFLDELSEPADAPAGQPDPPRETPNDAEGSISEDDERAIERQKVRSVETVTVRCTHCDKPVKVPKDAELAQCTSCQKRFWIELADID